MHGHLRCAKKWNRLKKRRVRHKDNIGTGLIEVGKISHSQRAALTQNQVQYNDVKILILQQY
jgi:hypothetical protein